MGAGAFGQSAYAPRFHTINAGVVLLNSNGGANAAPFVWNNLDQNTLVKPAAWNFENPSAPSVVNAQINARWGATIGSNINKDNAAYWEVQLAALSDDQLGKYDVLSLTDYGNLTLTGYEAARLRRFMDNGGTLWVDVASTTTADAFNALTLPLQLSASTSTRSADFISPLLNTPFNLSMGDIRSAESSGETAAFGVPGVTALDPIMSHGGFLQPVVFDGAFGTVGVASVGNGNLVVTTRAVARVLNEGFNASTGLIDTVNAGYQAENVSLSRECVAAGKLIINALNLNSDHKQAAQGSRATHGIVSDIGAPLLPSFSVKSSSWSNARPPVFYKGLMVVTTDTTISVYSAKPGTSLDESGVTDYGFQDFSLGYSYDLIWQSQPLAGPISTPTCAEVPTSSIVEACGDSTPARVTDQILVLDGNGVLQGFSAFQHRQNSGLGYHIIRVADGDPSSIIPAYSVTPASGGSARVQGTVPNAPVFQENVVYIADSQGGGSTTNGRVWMVNPATGHAFQSESQDFALGGSVAALFSEFSSGPTVGYIPVQDNSGAMDKVLYVPGYHVPAPGSGPTSTAAIYSFWVGVRGEAYVVGTGDHDAQVVTSSGVSTLRLPLRAFDQGLHVYYTKDPNDPLGLHVSGTHISTGQPFTSAEMTSLFTGGWSTPDHASTDRYTYLNLASSTSSLLTDLQIRVDYTIDWGMGASLASSILRGLLYLPDDTAHNRNIIGNLALTPSGNLIAVLSQGTPPLADPASSTAMAEKGGSIYNFSERGRGIFRLNYRYEAYDSHNIQTNQASIIHYPEAFTDNDPQLNGALANGTLDVNGNYPNAIKNLTFTSPPTVRDGAVYVTAVGWKNTTASIDNWIPVSVVVALKENPDPVVIYTGNLSANFQIVQPDIAASDDKTNPTHFAVLQPNQYVYNLDQGASVGTLVISNLMDRDNGAIGNALSTNQPLLLRQAGAPDQLLEPNQTSGAIWSPLLWYAVFPGYHLDDASMITGDTLFSSGWSVLPGLINGTGSSSLAATKVASIVAFNAAINSNDAGSFVADGRRTWMSQAHVFGGGGSSVASTNLLWPAGITDAESVATRVGQDALQGSTTASHITSGGGVLTVTADGGLYAYDSSSIMVTDSSRVARYSASGETLWSSEASRGSASQRDTGNGSLVRGLVTPVRAYAFKNDTVIVDAGANRIIRMSDTGREVRSIDHVTLDPLDGRSASWLPDGLAPNEPLTLKRPGDVAVYTEYVTSADARLARLTNPSALEYWIHYTIADTGNHRLVDLIDRYYANPSTGEIGDPITTASGPQLGILLWHSDASVSGKNWDYKSIARSQIVVSGTVHDVFAAGVGNTDGSGNGSIVLFGYNSPIVIGSVALPAIGNVFWDPVATSFTASGSPSTKLRGLNSVSMYRASGGNYPLIMVTDASGAYEISSSDGVTWTVQWMLPTNAYTAMRGVNAPYGGTGQPVGPGTPAVSNPIGLNATYARRLDEDQVLVVNGLVSGDFKGEILILNGTIDTSNTNSVVGFGFNKTNLGFGTNSIRYQLKDVRGSRAIQGPVFADRR